MNKLETRRKIRYNKHLNLEFKLRKIETPRKIGYNKHLNVEYKLSKMSD